MYRDFTGIVCKGLNLDCHLDQIGIPFKLKTTVNPTVLCAYDIIIYLIISYNTVGPNTLASSLASMFKPGM